MSQGKLEGLTLQERVKDAGVRLEVILGTQPISTAHLAPPQQTWVGRSPGLKPRG
jgi:hypothetical protein